MPGRIPQAQGVHGMWLLLRGAHIWRKLVVLFVGVCIVRAPLFGVDIGAPDFGKLPYLNRGVHVAVASYQEIASLNNPHQSRRQTSSEKRTPAPYSGSWYAFCWKRCSCEL